MKKYKIISIVVILSALLVCMSVPASAASGSRGVGSPTVPPSRYGNSLHRSPTYSQSRLRNEAAITGNIAGGSHFKGYVPYRSSYEFQGPTATSTIDSFLRYSSQPRYDRQTHSNLTPYYNPSRTVSTLRRNNVSGYQSPRLDYAGQGDRYKSVYRSNITTADIDVTRRYRPVSMNISELELKVLREAKDSNFDYRNLRGMMSNDAIREILTGVRDVEAMEAAGKEEVVQDDPLFSSVKPFEPVTPVTPLEPGRDGTIDLPLDLFEDTKTEEMDIVEVEDRAEKKDEPVEEEKDAEEESQAKQLADNMLARIDHQTARGILGHHKTFKEYAAAKYDAYMRVGDSHLKAGKFYKAADAYTLAEIYNFDRPEAVGSRGLALFAAGEFLTSAGYVEKAVSMSPDFAVRKIDLGGILDDETLEKRLGNLEKWYDTNRSARFAFLASYIYYHRGDYKKASESLDNAAVKMEGQPSLDAMRKAINKAMEAAVK